MTESKYCAVDLHEAQRWRAYALSSRATAGACLEECPALKRSRPKGRLRELMGSGAGSFDGAAPAPSCDAMRSRRSHPGCERAMLFYAERAAVRVC